MTSPHITDAHYRPSPNLLVSRLMVHLSDGVVRQLPVLAAGAPLARTLVGLSVAELCTRLYAPCAHPVFCDCRPCLDDAAYEDQTTRQWEDWQRPALEA